MRSILLLLSSSIFFIPFDNLERYGSGEMFSCCLQEIHVETDQFQFVVTKAYRWHIV